MSNKTYIYKKDSERKASSKATYYVTTRARKDLIAETGAFGYIVFEQMLNRRTSEHKPMTDEVLAKELGISKRKVSDARRALISKHWFLERKDALFVEYRIGKKRVMEALFGEVELPLQVKQMCKAVALNKLNMADSIEDTAAFLAEFEYLQTKAEQWIREAMDDDAVLHAIQTAYDSKPIDSTVDQKTALLCVMVGKMLQYHLMFEEVNELPPFTLDALVTLLGAEGVDISITSNQWASLLKRFDGQLWHFDMATQVITFLDEVTK